MNAAINPEIYAAVRTEAPAGEIDITPEIYVTVVSKPPPAEVDIKPEIYVTVYRPPQFVRISAATARTLKKTESASADSFRQVGQGSAVSGDSARKIVRAEKLTGDALRAIKIPQAVTVDSLREIKKAASISGDLKREVKATQVATADTCREVFVFVAQVVKVSGAAVRRIVRTENVPADTLKRTGATMAASGDTKRRVNYNVATVISGDLGRKVVRSELIKADTKIHVMRFEKIAGDSFRQLGVSNLVAADSLRKLGKTVHILGDTRRVQGISQNTSADTWRRLDYFIWKVDDTGALIQINPPRGNHILIGAVKTLSVSNWRIVPDDRQRKIETIGGVVVEDYGHVVSGDKISCTVTLDKEGAAAVYSYWHNRTFVEIVDEAGRTWGNLRVVVRRYGYVSHFRNYYRATLEFWKE